MKFIHSQVIFLSVESFHFIVYLNMIKIFRRDDSHTVV